MGADKNTRGFRQRKRAEKKRQQILAEAETAGVEVWDARPHGEYPPMFNGPCDCEQCQLWDAAQELL